MDNPLVERFQLDKVILLGSKFHATSSCLFRCIAAQECHKVKGRNIDDKHIEEVGGMVFPRITQPAPDRFDDAIVMEVEQETVENAAAGGDDHPALPVQNNASVNNGQNVEKGEDTLDPASRVDDGGDENGVQNKLQVGDIYKVFGAFQENDVDKGEEINDGNQRVMGGLDISEIGRCLLGLDENGGAQKNGDKEDPQKHQSLKAAR